MPSSSLPRPCGRISGAPIWRRRSPIIAAASAATVLLLARAEPSPFALRILSALVMAPVAIAAVWFGSPWLGILTALAAAVMAWEWVRLCRGGQVGVSGIVLILAALAAAVAAALAGAALGWRWGSWEPRSSSRSPGTIAIPSRAGSRWVSCGY